MGCGSLFFVVLEEVCEGAGDEGYILDFRIFVKILNHLLRSFSAPRSEATSRRLLGRRTEVATGSLNLVDCGHCEDA